MGNQYHIKLENYSLQKFKKSLKSRGMIPSRVILKDDIDGRFAKLENKDISNLKDLIDKLKTKPKIEQFSNDTGLSVDYLTILKRETKSYLPNPIRIDKYAGIETTYVKRLEAVGIKNTRHILNEAGEKTKENN